MIIPARWVYGIGDTPERNGDTIAYRVNGKKSYAVSVDYFETLDCFCTLVPPLSYSQPLTLRILSHTDDARGCGRAGRRRGAE